MRKHFGMSWPNSTTYWWKAVQVFVCAQAQNFENGHGSWAPSAWFGGLQENVAFVSNNTRARSMQGSTNFLHRPYLANVSPVFVSVLIRATRRYESIFPASFVDLSNHAGEKCKMVSLEPLNKLRSRFRLLVPSLVFTVCKGVEWLA